MGEAPVGVESVDLAALKEDGQEEEWELDRSRLCLDIRNTAIVSSLIGGFSLNSLRGGKIDSSDLALVIYCCNVVSVHACTCAALMSAMMFTFANGLNDEKAFIWVKKHEWLLPVPLAKFGTGCVCYLVSVIFMSYRHLDDDPALRYFCAVVGVMSVMMVIMTAGFLFSYHESPSYFRKKVKAENDEKRKQEEFDDED